MANEKTMMITMTAPLKISMIRIDQIDDASRGERIKFVDQIPYSTKSGSVILPFFHNLTH